MDIKISKALESIVAQVIFDTTREGVDHSLKDVLMLSLLRADDSMAHRLLAYRLKDWELYQIALRLEREIAQGRSAGMVPQSFFAEYMDELREYFDKFLMLVENTLDAHAYYYRQIIEQNSPSQHDTVTQTHSDKIS
jgi:hypothetical protein